MVIPCLHRVHDQVEEVPQPYHELNMTIQLDKLLQRLQNLHLENMQSNTTSLITFDDGWKDVFLIPSDFFLRHDSLKPVVFLTDDQLLEQRDWMPLHRLYRWMEATGLHLRDLGGLGIVRNELKELREREQAKYLDEKRIHVKNEPAYLMRSHLDILTKRGWKIGSHGPEHSDLRHLDDEELRSKLSSSITLLTQHGYEAWIAWPEGRWNNRVARIASEVGFTRQFGLLEEERHGDSRLVEMRTLW